MSRPTVLILGAGAAGLAAARALRRAGLAPVVVEARSRTGGRVDTIRDPLLGVPLERGAEFVHGRPPGVVALAREAGVRLRAVPEGMRVLRGGRLVDAAALDRGAAILEVARDDRESVAARLARARRAGRISPEALAAARSFTEGFYLADPRTASAAAMARMDRALEAIDGERSFRAEGGWRSLLAPLAAEAARAPGALRLGFTVRRIGWAPGRVRLEGHGPAGGPVPPLEGARLIVTLPVGVLRAGAVRFVPRLARRPPWERLEMGPAVKLILRFRRPPWEDRLRGRTVFLQLPGAPVPVFWTLAPRPAPILVGWAGGPRARRLSAMGAEGALRAGLRGLAPAFGLSPGALEDRLEAAEVVDWSRDPLALGGYAVFPVGSAGAAEALARPIDGTLFFAGEATEPDFAGTVDGALRSGARAARQVIESL